MNGAPVTVTDKLSKFDKVVQWFFTSSVPPWSGGGSTDAPRPPPGLWEVATASLVVPAYLTMQQVLLLEPVNGFLAALFFTLSPVLSVPLLFVLTGAVSYSIAVSFISWFCRMATILVLLVTLAGVSLSQFSRRDVTGLAYSFDVWFFVCLLFLCMASFLVWRKAHDLENRDGAKALIAFSVVCFLLRFLFFGQVDYPWFNFPA